MMYTIAGSVSDILDRMIVLHEQRGLALERAKQQVQEEYNRYMLYQQRCIVAAARPSMSFLAWLKVEAAYNAALARQTGGPIDIVAIAHLETQLALNVRAVGGSDGPA
jgi:hypothetical protein